jgi:regulatory protein
MPRKIARRFTADYVHNAALFYLQRYAASSGRVRSVLTRKLKRSCADHPDQDEGALAHLIDQEIEKLQRVELLKDDQLAGQLAEGWRGRGMAARMIAIKLQQRGFDKSVIQKTMMESATDTTTDTTSDQEEQAALRYLKRRKLGFFAAIAPQDRQAVLKLKQKSWASLARQGYDPDLIERVLMMKPDQLLS